MRRGFQSYLGTQYKATAPEKPHGYKTLVLIFLKTLEKKKKRVYVANYFVAFHLTDYHLMPHVSQSPKWRSRTSSAARKWLQTALELQEGGFACFLKQAYQEAGDGVTAAAC